MERVGGRVGEGVVSNYFAGAISYAMVELFKSLIDFVLHIDQVLVDVKNKVNEGFEKLNHSVRNSARKVIRNYTFSNPSTNSLHFSSSGIPGFLKPKNCAIISLFLSNTSMPV